MRLCFVQAKARPAPSAIAETVILSCAAALWFWSGTSTWSDLIGKPRDAPFLMIPGHLRAIAFWWVPALYALYSARTHKRVAGAFFALAVGPIVRFTSYVISWVASWPWVDDGIPHSFLWGWAPRFIYGHGIPDGDLKGDPRAWGSGWIYAGIVIGLGGFTYLCALIRRYETKIVRLQTENANLRAEVANLRSEIARLRKG